MAVAGYRETEKWLEREGYSLETAKPPSDSLFPNYATISILSESELQQCEEGALKGSGKAALIAAQYYSEIVEDPASAEYWYQIGAQNGNSECMYQFGNILLGKTVMLDIERGQYWLNLVKDNGYYRNSYK